MARRSSVQDLDAWLAPFLAAISAVILNPFFNGQQSAEDARTAAKEQAAKSEHGLPVGIGRVVAAVRLPHIAIGRRAWL